MRKTDVNKPPVTIGIDLATPNGDCTAVAVLQGNQIHSVIVDDLTKIQGDPRQLPPLNYGGTVTGRIRMPYNPTLWQIPKSSGKYSSNRYKHYLLRQLEVIAKGESNFNLSSHLHAQGMPGDVMVTVSYLGNYQAYFWAGKKKRCWRRVDSRKYPNLMPQLKAALLLQV